MSLGRYSYNPPKVLWGDPEDLTVGSFCSIASGVTVFVGGEHRPDWVTTFPFNHFVSRWQTAKGILGHPATKGKVLIGNDVWIGSDVLVLSGVTIGDGAVIGARSVVASDIKPYAIHAGNPARFIRYRFNQEQIDNLLRIRWWDWDDKKVERFIPLMLSSDIDNFIRAATNDTGNSRTLSS